MMTQNKLIIRKNWLSTGSASCFSYKNELMIGMEREKNMLIEKIFQIFLDCTYKSLSLFIRSWWCHPKCKLLKSLVLIVPQVGWFASCRQHHVYFPISCNFPHHHNNGKFGMQRNEIEKLSNVFLISSELEISNW